MARGNSHCLKALGKYGGNLGVAYQIYDDLRDREALPQDEVRLQEHKTMALEALSRLPKPAPLLEYLLDEIVPSSHPSA